MFDMYKPSLDELMHYGIKRRSGRYPWGSGDEPFQRSGDFLARCEELKKLGFKHIDENGKVWTGDMAIAKSMGLTSTEYRAAKAVASEERRAYNVSTAKSMRDRGMTPTQIGKELGVNESTVRSWFNEESEQRMNQARATVELLKKHVEEKGMIDVGAGVELELGISKEKLNQALYMLEAEGYPVYGGGAPQQTNPGKQTNLRVLCPPGTEHREIYNFDKLNSVGDYISYDGGETFKKGFEYPSSMDSKRLMIKYAEEGGIEKDGVIELRPGCKDLSLGTSRYSQVRILVDGDRYLKGMAVYSDDLPDGIDVRFNTNKKLGTPMRDVLKKISDDSDNPFGSLIKEHGGQSYYIDDDGKEKLSLINKRSDEGDWSDWKDKLPSQFLSKQNLTLIKKQLKLAEDDKQAEFDDICSVNNPTIKKQLLETFANDCDSAAVHLQAAALPGQKYHVILPVTSMKDTEVYAPNYNDGDKVALIRYPHGGTFEIPILTVNNKQPDAKKLIANGSDAVAINHKVAERLSGADFDGDTVMVIPCNTPGKVHITSTKPLAGLEGFDNKLMYGYQEKTIDADGTEHYYRNGREYRIMKNTQTEMGKISNLITDMTIKGADMDEIAAAVRHSMVVIDAAKHKLDYKQSEIDNNISYLKKTYQGRIDPETGKYKEGAATLISRAKSEVSVTKRQGSPKIDPETGKLVWKDVDDPYYTTKDGKTKKRTQASTQMAETDDARKLSTGHPKEEAYATYANKMKSLANQARKEILVAGKIPYSASARATFSEEVKSLESKLKIAERNAPKERLAQIMSKAEVDAKKQANPDMTKAEIKKAGQQALSRARASVGAHRETISITDREWIAIQSGAISENTLTKIIKNTDIDELRARATPRTTTVLSDAKVNKIASMNASGYTTAQIAQSLGVSPSTVSKYLKGGN